MARAAAGASTWQRCWSCCSPRATRSRPRCCWTRSGRCNTWSRRQARRPSIIHLSFFLGLLLRASTQPAPVFLRRTTVQVVYASAGAVAPLPALPGKPSSPIGAFTHIVHFRCHPPDAVAKVRQHPMYLDCQANVMSTACASSGSLVLGGSVEKDIFLLFRRSDDFAVGVEYVLGLRRAGDGSSDSQAARLLAQLAALAQSSIAGAIQVTYGPCLAYSVQPASGRDADTAVATAADAGTAAEQSPTHVLMARFTSMAGLQAFLATPQFKALTSSGAPAAALSTTSAPSSAAAAAAAPAASRQLPLEALFHMAFSVEPAESASKITR